MHRSSTWLIVLLFIHATAASADEDCLGVIALSKIRSETVQSRSQVEKYARDFCSEYASATGSTHSSSFGVAYEFLSLSMGDSSASQSRVASRYCDAVNQQSAKQEAYQQYVETIAPGAYPAYERCISRAKSGLSITVAESLHPTYLAIGVSFSSTEALARQEVTWSASAGVNCHWRTGPDTRTTVAANSSDLLICTRTSSDTAASVQVVPTTNPNSLFSFRWDRYQGSSPVNELSALRAAVTKATADLGAVTAALRDAVVAFNLPTCPAGWEEYTPAYGRFIRGIDKSGTAIDPRSPRTPGSLQDDEFKKHNHTRDNDVWDFGNTQQSGATQCGTCQGYGHGNTVTGETGGDETRPKNVALLYCTPKKT